MDFNQFFFVAILAASCGYAFVVGGRAERLGAGINAAATLVSVVLTTSTRLVYTVPEIGLLLVDVLVMASFLVLAIRFDRFWPIWAFAFALMSVTTHLTRMFLMDVIPRAYAIGTVIWAYPALIALVIGTTCVAIDRQRTAMPAR